MEKREVENLVGTGQREGGREIFRHLVPRQESCPERVPGGGERGRAIPPHATTHLSAVVAFPVEAPYLMMLSCRGGLQGKPRARL